MAQIQPKKSLGQHFLHDKNIARKIVDLLEPPDDSIVVEIGPGTGVLTDLLLQKKLTLIAVEVDTRSIDFLQIKYYDKLNKNFFLIKQDFLEFDFKSISQKYNKKVLVIGNIPYYITSPILFHLFNSSSYIEKTVMMTQKEIAEKLKAKIRTKDYGILTLACQLFGEINKIYPVPPSCFSPPPNVTSAFFSINFHLNINDNLIKEKMSVLKLIRTLFQQRRKTISNSLKLFIQNKELYNNIINNDNLIINKYLKLRPEELTLDDFLILHKLLLTF
jgi:16S rRNA (adenine1518-N6/adenine1519-N6)-dimethyltransferase